MVFGVLFNAVQMALELGEGLLLEDDENIELW